MAILRCFSILMFLFAFSPQANASSVHGVFKVVKGKVLVKNKSGKQSVARIGMRVYPQDSIKTGKDSRAKIVMTDNNVINVSPETEVKLSKYEFDEKADKKDVLIDVIYGKIRNKVSQKYEGKNKFQVKTPSAVAGVRGTDFLTSYNPRNRESQVITFEGRVEFGLPNGVDIANSVVVDAGKTSSVIAGKSPDMPFDLPVADLERFNSDSDADANFADSPDGMINEEPREPAGDEPMTEEPKEPLPGDQPLQEGEVREPNGDVSLDGSLDGSSDPMLNPDGTLAPPPDGSYDPALDDPALADGDVYRSPDSIDDSFLMPEDLVSESDNIYEPDSGLITDIPDTYIPPSDLYKVPDCGQTCTDNIEGTRRLIINITNQ